MINPKFKVREAKILEFESIGNLMVATYAKLDGFPKPEEQPAYYQFLQNIGEITSKSGVKLFVALDESGTIAGAVVYFSNMINYGSGGIAPFEKEASAFRLLAVDQSYRGQGIGKLLSMFCIDKAIEGGNPQIIIHSTKSMKIAWKMYEKLGFNRSLDLDFKQQNLEVFGFRLRF